MGSFLWHRDQYTKSIYSATLSTCDIQTLLEKFGKLVKMSLYMRKEHVREIDKM